jgi:prephenate dehydrogenase
MKAIAFLGYGRFGAALGALCADAGCAVRAMDPSAHVPDTLRATSLQALVAEAELVVVAIPVREMPEAFSELRPHLRPGQVVIDVGSVKQAPSQAMARCFGAAQPWVATHPLFGPTSLARGERPLRTIVCPNPLHPDAVRRVRALFERIGCEVLEQDPATHDRAMAYTHALAFFVAKGMLDAGAPTDAPYAPPSFQAIAKTIETVRSDAGHLFEALHIENPFAGEARHLLIEALTAADRTLTRLASTRTSAVATARGPLVIPDLGLRSPELRETRELIDELDQDLLTLLARRALLAKRAAKAKAQLGHGVRDPSREARVIEERRRWAVEHDVDPAAVASIFEAILAFSRRVQEPSPTSGETSTSEDLLRSEVARSPGDPPALDASPAPSNGTRP